MKLVLDEMYPAAIAVALRARGHDVIAVQEDEELQRARDADLFIVAQRLERALVTENVRDFLPLDAASNRGGQVHWGLVLTTNRSFPRHRPSFIGMLVVALDELLHSDTGRGAESRVVWLRPPDG